MVAAIEDRPPLDAMGFLDDPLDSMMRVYRRHGAGVTRMFGRQDYAFALGPECNRAIYTRPEVYAATGYLVPGPKQCAQRRLMSGIFNQNGQRHRDQRRVMTPVFQKAAIAVAQDAVAACCDAFLADWRWGETRDVSAEMLALVVRLNALLLLGIEADELVYRFERITEESMALNARLTAATSLALDVPRSWYDDAIASSERVEQVTRQVLQRRRENPLEGGDLLAVLLRAHAAEPDRLTGQEVVGQATHLFAASNQSTRSSIIWTLFLLAQHPEVMDSLYEELDRELDGATPTVTQVERLPLLDRVYRESVRLLTPVAYFTRVTAEPAELCGQHLTRGTTVVFSHYVTHHMSELFPEPERFDPDRWLTARPTPYEYIPFGLGARMCIAHPYANQIGRMVLATVLQRARLTIVPGTRVDRKVTTNLSPRHELPMRIDPPGPPYQASPVVGNIHEMAQLSTAFNPREHSRLLAQNH
jgi:cytochrome P450